MIPKARTVLLSILAASLVLGLALPAFAQRGVTAEGTPRKNGNRRVALVIGNSAYQTGRLKNPVNDARNLSATLKELAFKVTELENLRQGQMKRAIDEFGHEIRAGGVGFFFYAGHGVQVRGRNYLVPVGAVISGEADVEYECVDAGRVLAKMELANNYMNIMVLDACRNNPYAASFRSVQNGLASMNAPRGTIIAYSAAPGQMAADGSGRNSPFTAALIKRIATPGLEAVQSLQLAQVDVLKSTDGRQAPWLGLSPIEGKFYFNPDKAAQTRTRPIQLADSPGPAIGEVDQRKLKIQNLLRQADRLFEENSLTTPPGASAYDLYQQVLALAPMNDSARAGIKNIASKYVSWAESRIGANDFDKAEQFLARAEKVSEGDARILALRDRLRETRAQVSADAEKAQREAEAEKKRMAQEEASRREREKKAAEPQKTLRPSFISIGTGGTGGIYYPYGGGVAEIWNKHVPGVRAVAEVTGASVENVMLAHKGETVIGEVMGDVAAAGYNGSGKFRGKKLDILAMTAMYPNLLQVVALKSSGITNLEQVVGRTISTGSPGSGTSFMAAKVFKALGIPQNSFKDHRLSFTETADALRDGSIDVGILCVGLGTSSIRDLAATHDIRIIPLTPEQQRRILSANQTYSAVDLVEGVYRGQSAAVPTIGVWNVMIANKNLDPDLVYQLLKALYGNLGFLEKIQPSAVYTTPQNTVKHSPIPLHPGTIKYLKERDIAVPARLMPQR